MTKQIKLGAAPRAQAPQQPSERDIARAIVLKREQLATHFAAAIVQGSAVTEAEGIEAIDIAIAMTDHLLEKVYQLPSEGSAKEGGK